MKKVNYFWDEATCLHYLGLINKDEELMSYEDYISKLANYILRLEKVNFNRKVEIICLTEKDLSNTKEIIFFRRKNRELSIHFGISRMEKAHGFVYQFPGKQYLELNRFLRNMYDLEYHFSRKDSKTGLGQVMLISRIYEMKVKCTSLSRSIQNEVLIDYLLKLDEDLEFMIESIDKWFEIEFEIDDFNKINNHIFRTILSANEYNLGRSLIKCNFNFKINAEVNSPALSLLRALNSISRYSYFGSNLPKYEEGLYTEFQVKEIMHEHQLQVLEKNRKLVLFALHHKKSIPEAMKIALANSEPWNVFQVVEQQHGDISQTKYYTGREAELYLKMLESIETGQETVSNDDSMSRNDGHVDKLEDSNVVVSIPEKDDELCQQKFPKAYFLTQAVKTDFGDLNDVISGKPNKCSEWFPWLKSKLLRVVLGGESMNEEFYSELEDLLTKLPLILALKFEKNRITSVAVIKDFTFSHKEDKCVETSVEVSLIGICKLLFEGYMRNQDMKETMSSCGVLSIDFKDSCLLFKQQECKPSPAWNFMSWNDSVSGYIRFAFSVYKLFN